MKTQTTLREARGERLTDFGRSLRDDLLLIFGDYYVCLRAMQYYDDPVIEETSLDLFGFGDDALIAKGVVSESELEELRQVRDAEQEAQFQSSERAAYERLRKKFEGDH